MIDVTQLHCPDAPTGEHGDNETHHFVPRSAGSGGAREHVCRYCGRTERYLREQAEKHHEHVPYLTKTGTFCVVCDVRMLGGGK